MHMLSLFGPRDLLNLLCFQLSIQETVSYLFFNCKFSRVNLLEGLQGHKWGYLVEVWPILSNCCWWIHQIGKYYGWDSEGLERFQLLEAPLGTTRGHLLASLAGDKQKVEGDGDQQRDYKGCSTLLRPVSLIYGQWCHGGPNSKLSQLVPITSRGSCFHNGGSRLLWTMFSPILHFYYLLSGYVL